MRIVDKLKRDTDESDAVSGGTAVPGADALMHGALDTLDCVFRTLGETSFVTDKYQDPADFLDLCVAYARHIENGASVPSADIAATADGGRDWGQVRRFFVDRRTNETDFVNRQLGDYRTVVDDLVAGLRQIGDRDQKTEDSIIECLASLRRSLEAGDTPNFKLAVTRAVDEVHETFARQRDEYERQINDLQQRMSTLRQDLLAAREEMKRDNLTDVFNRGAFDTGIEQCINMNFMSGQPATLVLVDLDEFKSINDHHGHSVGDAVLQAVAEALSRSFIRKNDWVCRYGGDEFAVILNDTTSANSVPLIERFLTRVRQVEVMTPSEAVSIRCSVGFTELSSGDDSASFIDRADTCLYRAKAEGRDRAVSSEAAA